MGSITTKQSLKHLVHNNQCAVSTHQFPSLEPVQVAVTFAAYLGIYFFYIKWGQFFKAKPILVQYHGMWEHLEWRFMANIRDKKHDGSTQCYILLFILWPGWPHGRKNGICKYKTHIKQKFAKWSFKQQRVSMATV